MRGATKSETLQLRELCEALLSLDSVEECRRFLNDLCTPAELSALADRWSVARLLERGVPYRRIYDRTGVSTATVTRVARAMEYGQGGYRAVLAKTVKAVSKEESEK
jgi:TrpR-related protein YerC/YecD